jgi:hypothetical protein
MPVSGLGELHWWHGLVFLGTSALYPLLRAAAVVLVARCVKDDIAKLAIPLVLRPLRPSVFPRRRAGEDVSRSDPLHRDGRVAE